MAENIPNMPTGAVPPKPAEAAKVQPKKETVRINLPPKPTAAPTIKIPTPAAIGAATPAAPAPVAAGAPAAPAPAAVSAPAGVPPSVQRPAPAAAAPLRHDRSRLRVPPPFPVWERLIKRWPLPRR